MSNKKIDIKFLAKENIRKKPLRSISLISIIAIFVIFLFCGTILSTSISGGVNNLSNRLGADIIVVPEGYKANIESVLLTGEPSEFYLPDNSLEKIKTIEGIESATPQLYVATLSASCCSYPVQIIGIEYSSDFIIKPWLQKTLNRELKDDEVIVGSNIVGEANSKVKFFDEELNIVGKLEQTGMGFDATVFVNMKTAKKLAKASERIQKNPASEGEKISTILLKLKPNYSAADVSNKIMKAYAKDGIFAMYSKKFVNEVSSNLKVISSYIYISILVIWIMSTILLAVVFSTILNERKKELSILRILGASKKKLSKIIMYESLYIGLYGSLLGIIIGIIAIFSIMPIIQKNLNLPFLTPSFTNIFMISIFSMFVGTVVGCLSSLSATRKISKADAYLTMREND